MIEEVVGVVVGGVVDEPEGGKDEGSSIVRVEGRR